MTRFEDTQGAEWTTLADEVDLYAQLETSGRVTVQQLGVGSGAGLPIRLVTVDLPSTPSDAPSVLFVGLQHGNEPVGRETILSAIRDLAQTSDPDMLALLGKCRLHFLPTMNPTGFPIYRNVTGGDPNRAHLSLALAEPRHVQQAITDLDPILVVDYHEHFAPTTTRLRMELLTGGHPMSHPTVTALSDTLLADCQDALDAAGIDHALYSPATLNPWLLRLVASFRNCAFLLVESPAWEARVHPWERFAWYQVAHQAILGWIDEHAASAFATKRAAELAMIERGERHDTPFDLTNGVVLDPPPVAYKIPPPAPIHLDTFGLEYTESDGVITVPMAQPQHSIIPYLFDSEGPEPVVAGVRVPAPPPPQPVVPPFRGVPVGMKVRLNGKVYEVEAMKVQLDGKVYEASLPGQ